MSESDKLLMTELAEYRLKKQLTQEALAKMLKVGRVTLTRWLNKVHSPRPLERQRIKELLEKS